MKTTTTLLVCGMAAGSVWALWGDSETSESAAEVGVLNQIWIDRMPVREKDTVNLLALVSDLHVGLFNTSSAFEGNFALFGFTHRKGHLALRMLQTDAEHQLKYEIGTKGCGELFDYCLQVSGAPRGAKMYGTLKDWVIEGNTQELQTAVMQQVQQLRR